MSSRKAPGRIGTACLATLLALTSGVAVAQTQIKQGFNLFSVEQDQEIGQQSAVEAERLLPIVRDRSIEAHVNAIGKRLAAVAPGAKYPYQFKVVNASDINAFALPGGYMYLNRGLIEAARNEGQLAGVMAHEMSHVALRHGTSQASKAYLGQAGLGLLGGLLGGDQRSTEEAIAAVGGFGLNALFLKFSRTAETQADITGAQMLARAGYDPQDMIDFFEVLRAKQAHDPGKVEQFFSSHPPPAGRAGRIHEEMAMLTIRPTRAVGGFNQAKAKLMAMPAARSMQQIAQNQPASSQPRTYPDSRIVEIGIEPPSATFRTFQQRNRSFQIDYPSNWRTHEANQGYGVTIAPEGGFVDMGAGANELLYGVIVNHYDPFDDDAGDRFGAIRHSTDSSAGLVRATNDLLGQILQANSSLRLVQGSERRGRIDGAPSLSVVLSGNSPLTRREERITVFTREYADDRVLYALFIAPGKDYDGLNATFNRMISSLRVSDDTTYESRTGQRTSGSYFGRESVMVPSGPLCRVPANPL
jgi:beta-barrel assembly-enhancing protease